MPLTERARVWLTDGEVRDARAIDISGDGIGLELDQPLDRAEPVTVALQVPVNGEAVALAAGARTAYILPGRGRHGERYKAGLRFVTLDERTARTLQAITREPASSPPA